MRGLKTGGRKKGSKNKAVRGTLARFLPRELAAKIAQKDQSGRSMADIQLDAARWFEEQARKEQEREQPNFEQVRKDLSIAAKIAHDASPFIYATQAAVRHSGDENEPAIRVENLSDYQLQKLIERLRRS
jgi:hypothetical protein